MRNILKIYKRDMKSIVTNPVALIICAGLCVLPSLYAWVNIAACWDPYSNTSTIPVAVVNNDKGTTFKDKNLNIGSGLVEKLKNNKKIGWKFVGQKEADMGVVDGTYFAAIEVPEDFSSSFVSVLSDKSKKPQIIYKVDTKNNPVAGKITNAAKNSLVDQISSSFVATVNETVFASLNEVGEDAEKNKQNVLKLKDDIISVNKNMDNIIALLQSMKSNSSNLNTFLIQIKATMPAVSSGISVIGQTNQNNQNIIKSTQTSLNKSFDYINEDLNSAQASVNRIHTYVSELNNDTSNLIDSQTNSTIAQIGLQIDAMNNGITASIDFLQSINNSNPDANIANMIASLKSIQTSLNNEKGKLNTLQQQLSKNNQLNKALLNSINDDTTKMNTQLITATKQYNTVVRKDLNIIANNLITSTKDAADLINSAQQLQKQIENMVQTGIDGSQLATKVSGDLESRLLEFKDIIADLSVKLEQVNNNDLAQIITILQTNPAFMGDFVSSPFNLQEQSIYGVPNYGSAMTPVYTVLALWVGSLLLSSLLKVEVAPFEGSENFTLRQKHYGKMMTFVTLALIQGLIVSLGDKILLGVYTVNAFLMIMFAVSASITFSILTYTSVSLLGNIGKAFNIVFMIIQLAGSGGTYPIQVDPLIFRILQPLFPFTYAISGFREAIAGPIVSTAALDFIVLDSISLVFLLLGFFLKQHLHHPIHRFETNFKNSGLAE